jgi:hypothetical protein
MEVRAAIALIEQATQGKLRNRASTPRLMMRSHAATIARLRGWSGRSRAGSGKSLRDTGQKRGPPDEASFEFVRQV